jgi:NOL1/NOP2/fmu family ribosome biogenesis protein
MKAFELTWKNTGYSVHEQQTIVLAGDPKSAIKKLTDRRLKNWMSGSKIRLNPGNISRVQMINSDVIN